MCSGPLRSSCWANVTHGRFLKTPLWKFYNFLYKIVPFFTTYTAKISDLHLNENFSSEDKLKMCLIDLNTDITRMSHSVSKRLMFYASWSETIKKAHMILDEVISPKSLKGQHNPLFLCIIKLPKVLKRGWHFFWMSHIVPLTDDHGNKAHYFKMSLVCWVYDITDANIPAAKQNTSENHVITKNKKKGTLLMKDFKPGWTAH